MIFNWYPHAMVSQVTQISVKQLRDWNVKGVILDIDNTLTTHDNPVPSSGVSDWLSEIKNAGLKIIVLSNNNSKRVAPFASLLGLDFVPDGKKPLKTGYKRCSETLRIPCDTLCMIGDQLFTDIWGGRRAGCKTILVEPIQAEKMFFFKIKRLLERIVMKRYIKADQFSGKKGVS